MCVCIACKVSNLSMEFDEMADHNPSPKKLQGKAAIITGGASAIGATTTRVFNEQGARFVVIADVQDELGKEVASSIGSHSCSYVHCDVSMEEQVEALVRTTVGAYGRLDVMFCNAGVFSFSDTKQGILELDLDSQDKLFAVNVQGVAAGVKRSGRAMVAGGGNRSIICTASIGAEIGTDSFTDYTMSKHAVLGLVLSASRQLGKNEITSELRVSGSGGDADALPDFQDGEGRGGEDV